MEQEQTTPNPKCTRCKCYWKPDEKDIKSSGLCCKTCKKCREKSKKCRESKKTNVPIEETPENKQQMNLYTISNDIFEYEYEYEYGRHLYCKCGGHFRLWSENISRHLLKHQKYLKKIEEQTGHQLMELQQAYGNYIYYKKKGKYGNYIWEDCAAYNEKYIEWFNKANEEWVKLSNEEKLKYSTINK